MRYANLCWQAEKARLASAAGDLRSMNEAANKMERCGYYKEAWKTFHTVATLQRPTTGRPWKGPRDRVNTLCWRGANAISAMNCVSSTSWPKPPRTSTG